MACRLLIKNIPNTWACGDVVGVFPEGHMIGYMCNKAEFIKQGNAPEDWPRHFVIANVVDADVEDYEYLMEQDDEGTNLRYIEPQGKDSPFYNELLADAECTVTRAILDSLIRIK